MLSVPSLPTTSQHWEDCWTLILFHMRICSRCPDLCFLMVVAISFVIDTTAELHLVLPLLVTAQFSIPLVSVPSPTPTFLIFFPLLLQSWVSKMVNELSYPLVPEDLVEFSANQIVDGTSSPPLPLPALALEHLAAALLFITSALVKICHGLI